MGSIGDSFARTEYPRAVRLLQNTVSLGRGPDAQRRGTPDRVRSHRSAGRQRSPCNADRQNRHHKAAQREGDDNLTDDTVP